jgi:flagellar motor switch protein FliN
MNAIPPRGMKPGRPRAAAAAAKAEPPDKAAAGDGAARIEVAIEDAPIEDGTDPLADDEPEGLPDPAIFAGFMAADAASAAATADPREAAPAGQPAGQEADAGDGPVEPRPRAAGHAAGPRGAGGGASADIPPHLAGIEVVLSVEVGQRRLPLGDLLEVQPGQLFELDRLVAEPVSILVNGRPFATGEILAVGDRFGVRLLDLVDQPA